MLNAAISRRSVLKLGVVSSALLILPLWESRAIAQANLGDASKAPEGLISFNAGWAIPLEDKPALLALEQAKAPQITPSSATATDSSVKPTNKNWIDKAQEAWNKVKGFF
jgi:hypothetical protein